MLNSSGRDWKRGRPKPSQTLYRRSSPPVTMRPLTAFQSTRSTTPSWARQVICLAWGWRGLTTMSRPEVKQSALESGLQERE
jgi:hypothetical protein